MSDADLRYAAALARAITDKVSREQPRSQLIPATVINTVGNELSAGLYADVHIAGDPPGETRQVAVLTGEPLVAGDIVMVLFDPPEGAYVWSKAVPGEAAFTWSASLTSDANTPGTLGASSGGLARCEWPRHATNGLSDFNTADDPSYKIIIPRDGVYSASAMISFNTDNFIDFSWGLEWRIEGATDGVLLTSRQPAVGNPAGDTFGHAWLTGARVGIPLYAGDLISLHVANDTADSITYNTQHFDVTYEAALGTVWALPSGGDL